MNTKTYISIDNNLSEVKEIILGPDKRVVLLQRGVQILYDKIPLLSIVSSGEGVDGLVNTNIKYGDSFECKLKQQPGTAILSMRVIMGGIDISQDVCTPYMPQSLLSENNNNNNEEENINSEDTDNEENDNNEQENDEQDNGQ